MRASDLIGREVHCRDGRPGRIIDLRLSADTENLHDVRELRLDGLVVAGRRWGREIGYSRRENGRPRLIWWIMKRLHGRDRYVKWELVRDFEGDVVNVNADLAELSDAGPLPAAS